MTAMNFGERLRLLRERHGMTQQALGNLLDVNYSTVARWEMKSTPLKDRERVEAIAAVFGVTADWLRLGRDEDEPQHIDGGVRDDAASRLAREMAARVKGISVEELEDGLRRFERLEPQKQRALFVIIRSMANESDIGDSERGRA